MAKAQSILVRPGLPYTAPWLNEHGRGQTRESL